MNRERTLDKICDDLLREVDLNEYYDEDDLPETEEGSVQLDFWGSGEKSKSISFRNSNLKYVVLKGMCLEGIDFFQANLSNADLRGANLVNANLENANLNQADLRGSDLRGANLNGCDWQGVMWSGAKIDSYTKLPLPLDLLLAGGVIVKSSGTDEVA